MDRLLFTVLLVANFAIKSFGSCAETTTSLTELLLNESDQIRIFLFRVHTSYIVTTQEGEYFLSKGSVTEFFNGTLGSDTVYVTSGSPNTSGGGASLPPGSEWLVVSAQNPAGFYSGPNPCNPFSVRRGGDIRFERYLAIIRAWKKAVDSHRTGTVVLRYPEGSIAARGRMKDGRPHGRWKHYFREGENTAGKKKLKSIACYRNGILHGKHTDYTKNRLTPTLSIYRRGELVRYKSFYNTGRPWSAKRLVRQTPAIKIVEHELYYRNGQLLRRYQREEPVQLIPGHFGRYTEVYVEFDSNGLILQQGHYRQGAKVGKWVETDPNSMVRTETVYTAPAPPDAPFYRFHPNGMVALTGSYREGKMDGQWVFYTEEGIKSAEMIYVQGLKHGQIRRFSREDGHESSRAEYRLGRQHGAEQGFFPDGGVSDSVFYEDGLRSGTAMAYWAPGKIRSLARYKKNLLHGEMILFSKTGDTVSVWNFQDGYRHGPARESDGTPKGTRTFIGQYHQGFKVGEWLYFDETGSLFRRCRHKPGGRRNGSVECDDVK